MLVHVNELGMNEAVCHHVCHMLSAVCQTSDCWAHLGTPGATSLQPTRHLPVRTTNAYTLVLAAVLKSDPSPCPFMLLVLSAVRPVDTSCGT
jgi:hypothetical protein